LVTVFASAMKEHQRETIAWRFKLKVSTGTKSPRSRVLFAHLRVPDIQHPSPDRDGFCNMCIEHGDKDSSSSSSDDSS
jgi:hypothetical protein